MNDAIVKQAAALITGGSTFTQQEREEMARAILALVPVPDAEEIKRRVTAAPPAPSEAVKALRLDTSKPEFDDFDRGWEACLDAISSLFSHPSCDKRIRSALSAQVQDVTGWQLVPKEPTQAMVIAYNKVGDDLGLAYYPNARLVYRAMLAAAPAKQEGGNEMDKISQDEIALMFPDGLPMELVKVMFPEMSKPLTPDEIRFLMRSVATTVRQYNIGPRTLEQVFEAAGLVNMSDLQAVMDAVERALTSQGIKPLEWNRGEYVSTAKSIDNLAFTVQMIGGGDKGWALHTYLTNETKRTHHPTREAAEQAAQDLHNAELAKYLSG